MTRMSSRSLRNSTPGSLHGFTLIELMIVLAIIAIILTLALPVYMNYTIRTKVGEALAVAAAAKTSIAATCHEDLTLTSIDNSASGYTVSPSTWVASIDISGNCDAPVITMVTQNTGAPVDPVLTLTGAFIDGVGAVTWICQSNSPNYLMPETCRS